MKLKDCCEDDPSDQIRRMVRWHYYRNRHLTPLHDVDDLFQDAWIHLNQDEYEPGANCSGAVKEEHSEPAKQARETLLRKAVSRAASQAFGKLQKRVLRGTAKEVNLEFDPASCIPDFETVMDLRDEIESLPPEERAVIELLRLGYDGNEIATLLDVKPQTVSRRKHKAICRLRRTLVRSE